MIRLAKAGEVKILVDMGLEFVRSTEYASLIEPNAVAVASTMNNLIAAQGNNSILLVAEVDGKIVAMLGLVAYTHPFSGLKTVAEMFWWVCKGYRGRLGLQLMNEGEKWARHQNAKVLQMIAPNDRVEKIYRRHGYTRVEVNYQKRLS